MSTNPPLFGAHALDGIRVIDLTRVLGGRMQHRFWPIMAPR